MKRLFLTALAVLILRAPPSAQACGGPSFYPVGDVLAPVEDLLENLLTPIDHFGDGFTIEPFLFLYPFHVDPARREQVRDLWNLSYGDRWTAEAAESAPSPSAADLGPFEAALRAGDLETANAEAARTVERVLDMPLALANQNAAALARGLEFLELKPWLPQTPAGAWREYFLFAPAADRLWPKPPARPWAMLSLPLALQQGWIYRLAPRGDAERIAALFPQGPRAATLRFMALQDRYRREIPNGWLEEIRDKTAPETWRGLENAAAAWLTDFPSHPLADLARLTQLRAFYYQGKAPEAWDLLFSIYPRRLPRVLGEMRFLLKQGLKPARTGAAERDPVLKAALLPFLPDEPGDWDRDWRTAAQALPVTWAVNMQERLLSRAVATAQEGKPLPAAFPQAPGTASELWGQLRAMALLKAGRLDAARTQAEMLNSSEASDLLRSRVLLGLREWTRVLAVPKLPDDAKRYLLRVLYDVPTLRGICRGPAGPWRDEACLALALREAARGDWSAGAALLTGQAKRSVLWNEAASLAADTSPAGLLAYARFLRANRGKLFFPTSTDWYRSLNFRLLALKDRLKSPVSRRASDPWSPLEESRAIQEYFTAGTEGFYALRAYASWLKAADPKDKAAARVLREADQTYNGLINWDNWNSPFWQEYLENSEWARVIREAGKKIR